jgi:hypothetical protein
MGETTRGAAGSLAHVTDTHTALTTAEVATERPGRYGKQLVSHLSRRSVGEWDDAAGTGFIDFESGRAELVSGDGVLHLSVRTAPELLPRYEDVVGRHLVRFGTRDELVVRWVREDGSAGTEQRLEEDPPEAS